MRWCCGAAAPSSSTAPQQDVCCGAVRGMALTPTLAVAPGLCSALAPLWPGPTSGQCGQCRAGIKWNEAHYVGLTRGSVQCLLVLSCCVARWRHVQCCPVLAGALEQAHTISPQNWLARCALERGCWHWYLWRWSSTEHLSVTPATPPPLLCSIYALSRISTLVSVAGQQRSRTGSVGAMNGSRHST